MGNSLKQQLGLKWRTLKRCRAIVRCSSAAPIEPSSLLKQQFLPVLCVGSTSCKGYMVALHLLTSPALLRILTDAASYSGYAAGKASRALTISCEPDTFEATFCLLQRSFKGLIHIPITHNNGTCSVSPMPQQSSPE